MINDRPIPADWKPLSADQLTAKIKGTVPPKGLTTEQIDNIRRAGRPDAPPASAPQPDAVWARITAPSPPPAPTPLVLELHPPATVNALAAIARQHDFVFYPDHDAEGQAVYHLRCDGTFLTCTSAAEALRFMRCTIALRTAAAGD